MAVTKFTFSTIDFCSLTGGMATIKDLKIFLFKCGIAEPVLLSLNRFL